MTRMPSPDFHGTARIDRFLPVAAPGTQEAGPAFSLADLPAMAWRQRWVLAGIVGLALVIGLGRAILAPTLFTAAATLRIDNEPVRILEGQDLAPVVVAAETARHLNTQVQTVASRSLAAEVADVLRLDRDNAFLRAMAVPLPTTTERPDVRRDRVIAALQGGVAMRAEPDSRVATIAFTSPDRVLSARIANAYADRYIDRVARDRSEVHAYARQALAERVAAVRSQLLQTEQAAIAYARQNRLVDLAAGPATADGGAVAAGRAGSLITERLVELNRAQAAAQASRIAAEARWHMASQTPSLHLPEAQANTTVQNLQARRAGLAADLAQLRARYREGQPEVQEKAAELQQVEGLLTSAMANLALAARAELLATRTAELGLARATQQLARASLDEQERRVRLNLLQREADTQRRQLDSLLARLNQVQSASDLAVNSVRLLDRAVPGSPAGPGMARGLLIALAGGLALALLLAVLSEALDDTLHGPGDARRRLGLRLLGTTPWVGADGEILDEACAAIQATVDHYAAGSASRVLLVTVSARGEGASTTALALARSFARSGRKVLLVDADFRQPACRGNGPQPDRPGLAAVLMQEAPFSAAVVQDGDGLHRLPAGPGPVDSVALFAAGWVADFVAARRRDYDLILIDAPPAGAFADALLLARHADFTLFTAQAGRTRSGSVREAVRRIEDAGGTVLGLILTGLVRRGVTWRSQAGFERAR